MIRAVALSALIVAGLSTSAFAQTAANLVGTYSYNGTNTDGEAYGDDGTLVISTEKSGAYGVRWDDGDYVGVGQVTGNVFAVAAVADGKNTVMLMTINPDGSLKGPWWRRQDPGTKGTEIWKKK
jgi:hypothetical protein